MITGLAAMALTFATTTAAAGSAPIGSPILPPPEFMTPRLVTCLEGQVAAVAPLPLDDILLALGPGFARRADGTEDRTRAEYTVVGRSNDGRQAIYRLQLVSADRIPWRFYQDRNGGIGMYGESLEAEAALVANRSDDNLATVDLDPCRTLLGR